MATATLSRGSTSVTLPLLDSASGTPLVNVDIGKPNLQTQPTGTADPRHLDSWSINEQFTLTGRFIDSGAYTDAIALCDLIKTKSTGDDLTLNLDFGNFESDILVAPGAGQDQPLGVTYLPGRRNQVGVTLSLTRIQQTIADGTQATSTPTTAGSGPIELRDSTRTVELHSDVTVERGVGRPGSTVRRSQDTYPRYYDNFKTAYDAFEISFETVSGSSATLADVKAMFRQKLARESLTLDFNGLYGMGAFNVIPEGTGALRYVSASGEAGVTQYPKISLRRVQ